MVSRKVLYGSLNANTRDELLLQIEKIKRSNPNRAVIVGAIRHNQKPNLFGEYYVVFNVFEISRGGY